MASTVANTMPCQPSCRACARCPAPTVCATSVLAACPSDVMSTGVAARFAGVGAEAGVLPVGCLDVGRDLLGSPEGKKDLAAAMAMAREEGGRVGLRVNASLSLKSD